MKQVTGRVGVKRRDGDREAIVPMEGVVVSTDSTVRVTDATGAYTLPVGDGDRFVKVTTPRGMRAEGVWFYDLRSGKDAPGSGSFDFTLVPDAARDEEAFAFVQVTDLHVDSRSGRVTPSILRNNLARLMADWSDKVSFVAATGDLTTHGDVEELIGAREVLEEQPMPVFPLPGNHDLRGEGGTERYLDYFGPDSYSFDWGPVHFIAYNAVDDEPPTITSWLLQDLALVPKGRPVVLLLHFPLGDIFYDALRPYPIVASLCGHWHASRLYHDGRTAHYSTPPFNFGGGDYTPGCYRVFRWADGALECRTFALSQDSADTRLAPVVNPRFGYCFRATSAPGDDAADRTPVVSQESLRPTQWPQHMGGPHRMNVYNAPETEKDGALGREGQERRKLTEAWRFNVPGGLQLAAPIVSSERLFIGTLNEDRPQGGRVVSLDARTGEPMWTTAVGESIKNTLATDGKRVFGATVTGEVFALDVESGDPVWRMALHTPSLRWIYSAPLLAEGKVTVGMSGHFACFDAETGVVIWERRDLSGSDWICSFASPAGAGDVVIVGFYGQDVSLLAFDAHTGDIRWENGDRTDSAMSTPAVDGDVFYVLRRDGTVQKATVAEGEVVWSREIGIRTPATPVVSGNRLYLVARDGRLIAMDTVDGELLWERRIGPETSDNDHFRRQSEMTVATPLVVNDTLWVPGGDGVLYAFGAADGTELARRHVGVPLLSSPVPAEDGLYVADVSGCIHALKYA